MAINRQVAVKAIPLAAEFSDSELTEARSRFFREAETAGRLNHPNIVTIYDVGEERGLAYIAMEYLKGRHLSDFASADNLLEPRKVLDIVARTADALGFAHKQHVVHRDIKPANLMYDAGSDVLKITDFGIARLTGAGSTRTGIVLGTPSFMSPEQLEGRTVTGHSDLFSLGVSLFQLLTGQLPFTADSMTGLMQQIAEAPHPPLRAFRPDLPACVESVIDRALAKNPDARFDSGAQMAAALQDCRSQIPSG
jgi:serine/threonine-protein kinase